MGSGWVLRLLVKNRGENQLHFREGKSIKTLSQVSTERTSAWNFQIPLRAFGVPNSKIQFSQRAKPRGDRSDIE